MAGPGWGVRVSVWEDVKVLEMVVTAIQPRECATELCT